MPRFTALASPWSSKFPALSLVGMVTVFVLSVCLALAGINIWSSVNSHEAALRNAQATTFNLARSLAQHADDALRVTDVVLVDLKERFEAPGGLQGEQMARARRVMDLRRRELPFLQRLALIDAQGTLIYRAPSPNSYPTDYRDRKYYIHHLMNPEPGAYIGPAIQSRLDGSWIFTMSHRLNNPDGSFAGVVVATIDVGYFLRYYASFDIGKNGSLKLLLRDGSVVVRLPFIAKAEGADLSSSPIWRSLEGAYPSGFATTRSSIDQIERLNSFVALPTYPLVMIAALSTEEIFSAWWMAIYWQTLGGLLLTLSLGVTGFWLVRMTRIRAAAERALKASELRWKYAIEGVGDGLWDWQNRTGRVHYSRQWKAMLGFDEQDIGDSVAEFERLVHPEDLPVVRRAFADYAAGRQGSFGHEIRMIDKTRQWRWILVRGMIVERDANGRPLRTIGTHTDITARKKMERALRISEQRFRLLVEEVRDYAIFLLDVRGDVVTWNKGAQRITGYVEDEIVGRHYSVFFTDDDNASGKPLAALVIAAQAGRTLDEGWRVRKDRSRFWASSVLTVVTSEEGKRIGYAKVLRDTTESRRLEKQLRESEALVRATLDALPAEICVIDREGMILAVNQAWRSFDYEWLPKGKYPAVGEKYVLPCGQGASLQSPTLEHVKRAVDAAMRGAIRSFSFEYSCQNKARQRWFRVKASRFGSPQPRLVLAHENITDIKLAELDLKFSATVYRALGEAIVVLNANDEVVAINPAFTQFSGYLEPAIIGERICEILLEESQAEFLAKLRQQLDKTGRWQGQIWIRTSNGDNLQSWLMIDTIYDEHDQPAQRVCMFSKVTDHKLAAQTIWEQANFDALTGLPNRSMFHDRLDHEVKKSRRTHLPLALLFIDLDRFKDINDTLGHAYGDILLQETARRLLSCVRDADTVARLGGDEFTVILGDLGSTNIAARIAADILKRLAEPFELGQEKAYISASIGITHYPQDAERVDALIKNADQAMYAAKAQGRNRYKYFTASMQEAAQARMRMVNDLRGAVAGREFRVLYQPIVALSTGKVSKAEALVRWQHPQRGMVSPNEFIALAEETGLINEIGNWVFGEVAQQLKRWRSLHDEWLQVSVNLSPAQFRNDGERDRGWVAFLEALGLPGPCMALEITEGMLMEPSGHINSELHRFREAGLQVSLDDFGTGYSSLAYLKKFDIDTLKIDQSFVRNMTPGSDDLALCEAIIVMAHKLGIQVVAEGVETREQCDMLVAAGCDFGQGYFFSHPLAADDFARLWRGEQTHALTVG